VLGLWALPPGRSVSDAKTVCVHCLHHDEAPGHASPIGSGNDPSSGTCSSSHPHESAASRQNSSVSRRAPSTGRTSAKAWLCSGRRGPQCHPHKSLPASAKQEPWIACRAPWTYFNRSAGRARRAADRWTGVGGCARRAASGPSVIAAVYTGMNPLRGASSEVNANVIPPAAAAATTNNTHRRTRRRERFRRDCPP
jgi:hypothetical protein